MDRAIAENFRGLHDFRCYRHVGLAEFETCNLPCVYALFRIISVDCKVCFQFLNLYLPSRGTKYVRFREHVPYLHSAILLTPARLFDCNYLQAQYNIDSSHGQHIFLCTFFF